MSQVNQPNGTGFSGGIYIVDPQGLYVPIVDEDGTVVAPDAPDSIALTNGHVLVGNASNLAADVAMSGDVHITNAGATAIQADAVTTAKILNANVTLAKLASGVSPAFIVKFAGKHTTTGGSATEAFTVSGVASTDVVFAQLQTAGGTPRIILTAAPTTNTLTLVFSGDPSTDHIVAYQVLRAAA